VWYTRLSATNRNWEARIMWNELGISGGTAIIILIALYSMGKHLLYVGFVRCLLPGTSATNWKLFIQNEME
jgi:hypothetical protein